MRKSSTGNRRSSTANKRSSTGNKRRKVLRAYRKLAPNGHPNLDDRNDPEKAPISDDCNDPEKAPTADDDDFNKHHHHPNLNKRNFSSSATSFDTPISTSSATYHCNHADLDLDGSTAVYAFRDKDFDYDYDNVENDAYGSEGFDENNDNTPSDTASEEDDHDDEDFEDLDTGHELQHFFKKYNLATYLQSKTGASLTLNVATTYQNYFVRFFKWWKSDKMSAEDAASTAEAIPDAITNLFNNIDISLHEYVANILEEQDGLTPKTCLNTITGTSIYITFLFSLLNV
jgi:hypothetical protein